ncbi:MAG: N-acetylglucosamine-6-phosphate deacetylase [Acidimicrobiales bacterium]
MLRPDGSLRPGAVVWTGDRIEAVEELGPGPHPDRTLAPGFVDLQVNGYAALDVAGGSGDDLDALDRTLAAAGTTAWCPTLTSRPLDWYAGWFAAHQRRPVGELAIHLEGPFLSRAGAHRPDALRTPDATWIAALPGRVGLVTLAPELAGAPDAIAQLIRRSVVAALGHSEATYAEAVAAAERGATLVTHVFNAMPGLHHREPGLVGAALARDDLTPAVIGDGVHVHPAVLRLVLASGPAILVSDSVAWEQRGLVIQHGAARLPDGTIAGSVITLADAVRVAVDAGAGLTAALVAAAATPARIMGRSDLGVLAAGARADIVELDPELRVRAVWRGGEEARGR